MKKDNYIEMIDELNIESDLLEILTEFVETLGEDVSMETHRLVLGVIASAVYVDELESNLEGFERVEKIMDEHKEKLEEMADLETIDDEDKELPLPLGEEIETRKEVT